MEDLVTRPSPEFWRGRRIWLTGHSGFKGAWLSLWLTDMGAEVFGFSLPPERPEDAYHSAGAAKAANTSFGDLRDAEALARAYGEAAPDIVLHLAAQPLVRRSYDRPLETMNVNIEGVASVLALCHHAPTPPSAVVVATTDKVYRNAGEGRAFVESDPLGGHDPYSASKAAAEIVVESWRKSFLEPLGVPVATARAGNVIGGGDFSPDRLVPDAIRAFRTHEPLRLRMPQAVRPWQHVVEPLAGYLLLAEALANGRNDVRTAFNFGPDHKQLKAVGDVAERMAALWGEDAQVVIGETDATKPEAATLSLDSAQASERLGWRPCFGFEDSLDMTIAWYRAWANGADAKTLRDLMRAQIDRWTA